MKVKDSIMSERVAEELFKLGDTNAKIARKLRCSKSSVSNWICGDRIPTAYNLKSLHYAGCDVIYILTGERE